MFLCPEGTLARLASNWSDAAQYQLLIVLLIGGTGLGTLAVVLCGASAECSRHRLSLDRMEQNGLVIVALPVRRRSTAGVWVPVRGKLPLRRFGVPIIRPPVVSLIARRKGYLVRERRNADVVEGLSGHSQI